MPKAKRLVYNPDGTQKDPAVCEFCGVRVARPCDLHRHTQRHLRGEERALSSFSCPFPDCGFKSLQKSNMDTHIRSVHTRIKNQECPDCKYATADPGSLTRHRKRRHEYVPEHRKARIEPPTQKNPEIIIVNPDDLYAEVHSPGCNPSKVLHTTKTLRTSRLNFSKTTSGSVLDAAPLEAMIPPKGSIPRPPSIAGLLNAPHTESLRIRPSNLAALLNPLPEPPMEITRGVSEESCYAEKRLKINRR